MPRLLWTTMLSSLWPLAAADLPLVDWAAPEVLQQISLNGGRDAAFALIDGPAGKALEITCTPGENSYPGVAIKPAAGVWDLAAYGTVQAQVTNIGGAKLTVTLRLDNPGDWQQNPWNADHVTLEPGQSGRVTVYFGYSWGRRGYALDPTKINQLLLYTGKPAAELKLRVDSIVASGAPGSRPPGLVDPLRPAGGVLLDLAQPVTELHGATATVVGEGAGRCARVEFAPTAAAARTAAAFLAPPGSIWNLSDYNQVEFALRNPGDAELKLVCRVDNRGANGRNNCAVATAVLPAGATQVVAVPFASAEPWRGERGSGAQLSSDAVVGVTVAPEQPRGAGVVEVLAIKATVAPPPVLPAWVGKQPPVAGNWTETFRDEFDSPTLDLARWTVPDKDWASWWGNSSINSARNVLVENGLMKLRAEAGIRPEHAADPKMKDRKYVTGVVTTLDKFRQRYGYFEARVKMPKAMGLWPAFWMMPDRGPGAKDRQSTHQGGNELDIWESLVRFGPYRYNIAVHWDGYGKEHQSIGTERIYAQPDADGWLVTGLLWEPGKLTWYANGQAVGVWANERVATVPGYLMFTLPTGGWGTNGLAEDAALPDTLDIDWVRCWQNLEWSQP